MVTEEFNIEDFVLTNRRLIEIADSHGGFNLNNAMTIYGMCQAISEETARKALREIARAKQRSEAEN